MARDEYWRGHVDAFLRQRGTQRDYCQQHGLSARELRKWRTRFYGPVRMQVGPEPSVAPGEAGLSEFSYAAPMGPDGDHADGSVVLAAPVIRRRWTDEQKRQLVWDGLNSGQPLARYARRHGVHPSVVHRWLRIFARPMLTGAGHHSPVAFAAVQVTEESAAGPITPSSAAGVSISTPISPSGRIEIELAGGRRLRVDRDVDVDALRRIVAALEMPS